MDEMESLGRLADPPLAQAPPMDDIKARARSQLRARRRNQALAALACAGLVLFGGANVRAVRDKPDVLLGPPAVSESPRVESATAEPTSPALATVSPEELADVVVEAGADWFRYSDGEQESLPLRFPPIGEWRLLGDGSIAYQHGYEKPIMILRVGQRQPEVLVERPTEGGRVVTLVGSGRVDGRDVALVADGTANSGADDEGTDIVAVDPENADRTLLVDDAANAWEGGVSLASVDGRWLVYYSTLLTKGSIVAVDRASDTRHRLRYGEADGRTRFEGLQLLRDADNPTAVLLIERFAAHPQDPTAELDLIPLDGTRKPKRRLPVPGISWKEGLPWSLSVSDRFIVVNRQEEQAGPAAALAYNIDEATWYQLPRPAFIAMQ